LKIKTGNISYLFSISVHAVILLFFVYLSTPVKETSEDYLLIGYGPGFGPGGGSPGSGGEGGIAAPDAASEPEQKDDNKKVDLPASEQNRDEDAVARHDKNNEKTNTSENKVKPLLKGKAAGDAFGYNGDGNGNGGGGGFGFQIDFGGKGMRRIYSYLLPAYPEGVAKEVDLKIKFTILADGSIVNIYPLIKADTRLEMAAINSLRQWRFEPLPKNAKQIEQTVVVTFPYRLQ
jgi:Gram-negative bacterial TonB protein C-terminal